MAAVSTRSVRALATILSAALVVPVVSFVTAPPAAATSGWEPQGKIAFVRDVAPLGAVFPEEEIWVANSDGTGEQQLTRDHYDSDPQWSPNGRLLAFTREYENATTGIVTSAVLSVDPTGSQPIPMALPPASSTAFNVRDRLIAWRSDGAGILFHRRWQDCLDDPWNTPCEEFEGVFHNGGATAANLPASLPVATPSDRCDLTAHEVDPSAPETLVHRTMPHPDPGDPRMLLHVLTPCIYSDMGDDMSPAEAQIGTPGAVATTVPVTYPQLYPLPWAKPWVNEFGTADWSPDGTRIYDGDFWTVAATGGVAEPVSSDMLYRTGYIPELDCNAQVSGGGATGLSASWSPAGDQIVANMYAQAVPSLGFPNACQSLPADEDPFGLWSLDPAGDRVPRRLLVGGFEPDVQCKPGSCLTILRVVAASGSIDETYTFSGDISGTTSPVDAFGTGGVLTQRVTPGIKTVNSTTPAGETVDAITCTAAYTPDVAAGSVQVSVPDGEFVTCTFSFSGVRDDDDGDGISNADDACPQTYGVASANGCPDADGDSVADAEDQCPNEAGTPARNGCPEPREPTCTSWRHDVELDAGTLTSRLFEFDSTVFYKVCTEPATLAKSVEVGSINPYGFIDSGVTAGVLEALGFTTTYAGAHQPIISVLPGGASVLVIGDFEICFDFLTLLDKLGLKTKLERFAGGELERLVKRYGKRSTTELLDAVGAAFSDFQDDGTKVIARYFDSHTAKALTPGARTALEEEATRIFRNSLHELQEVTEAVIVAYPPADILSAGRLALEFSQWLSRFTTQCFLVWQPEITHTFNVHNAAVQTFAGFENPFFANVTLALDERTGPLP